MLRGLFAAGIALTHFVWLRPGILLIALIPVVLLCCIAAFCAQRIAWFPLAVLWCLAGRVVRGNGAAPCAGSRACSTL